MKKNTSEAEFSDNDRCEVDATDFVFKQSEGAVMSRKTQRRMLRQTQAEVVWAGPAVVREQRIESRVLIGHRARGSRMRKVLFADSDEDGSDGISNGSVREGEGEESRVEIRARQRSAVISQDKTEVKRRVAAKSVRSLTKDPDIAAPREKRS